MKVSLQWLKELVPVKAPAGELAKALTMGGLEVEEITPVAGEFTGIVVAYVKSVAPHPNADKLRVTEVDAGTGETLQIVCGAPNVAAGQKVPCALVGAKPEAQVRYAREDPFEPARWWRNTGDAMAVTREVFGLLNAKVGFPVKSERW